MRLAQFRGAVLQVVAQRVDAGGGHIGVFPKIECGVEQGMRLAALVRAFDQEVEQRISVIVCVEQRLQRARRSAPANTERGSPSAAPW